MEDMKRNVLDVLELADSYVREEMRLVDVAVLKICLLSLGVVLGILVPRKWKRPVVYTSLFVFLATYLPLVTRFGAFLGKSYCELKRNAQA